MVALLGVPRRAGAWGALALAAGALLLGAGPAAPAEPTKWFATGYGGVISRGNLGETGLFGVGAEGSYLLALTGGRRLGRMWGVIDWELEGQVVKHFVRQTHWEFNGLVVARWLPFPWDGVVDTSLAVGEGVSFASRVPALEDERHHHSAKVLDYLLFELAAALPSSPQWSVIARIHHRSGAWGTFNGVHEGSNFWALGLRRDF